MIRAIIIPLMLGWGSIAWSETTAGIDWLVRMTQSFDNLPYDGVFVHQEAGTMNSMRVRHGVIGGVEYESLEYLDSQSMTVIRADDSVICVVPEKEDYTPGFIPNEPFERFRTLNRQRLLQAYTVKVVDQDERIASRAALKLRLLPKDEYRYAHEFWIDKENAFLLKHDVLDMNNRLLERIQFTSVSFAPDLNEHDFIPDSDAHSKRLTLRQQNVEWRWTFDWLPDGFALVWQDARRMNDHTNVMLLSDGMSSVSVFVEKTTRKQSQKLMSLGVTVAGEQSIRVGNEMYLLTLVGEVPAHTIQRLMTVIMPRTEYD